MIAIVEWRMFSEMVLKTVDRCKPVRGFESLPLRYESRDRVLEAWFRLL